MSEHDDPSEEHELYEEVPPRSIFAATWFRVLLVVIVVGVIGAVAIPYVLDFMNPPPSRPTTAAKPSSPAAIPASPSSPAADKPAADKPETPLIPAPAPPSTASAVDTRPAPPTARPVEPKPAAPKAEPKTAATPSEKGKTAMAVTETTPPKSATPTARPAATAKPDTTAKPDAAARGTATKDTLAKADTTGDTAKPAAATKPAATPKRAAAAATTTNSRPSSGSGPFWVQVGAFKDVETAKKVAAKLREDNFKVEESVKRTGGAPARPAAAPPTPAPAPKPDLSSDHYDVFVSGQTPEELNKRLSAKGLAAEASSGGMVVKPSLPLRDAVALSKDLAVEGFKVQVRRAGGSMGSAAAAAAATPAPSAPVSSEGGSELYRVRVGSFADRAAAQEAVRQLEAKGYKPYIARGDQ